MIFGQTNTQRGIQDIEKSLHGNYFALFPTRLIDGRIAWLQKIWRKEIEPNYEIDTCGGCIPVTQYIYSKYKYELSIGE